MLKERGETRLSAPTATIHKLKAGRHWETLVDYTVHDLAESRQVRLAHRPYPANRLLCFRLDR